MEPLTTGDPKRIALELLEPPADWASQARCKQAPTPLFFPDPADRIGNDAAVRVCQPCPVIDACRAYALAAPAGLAGVWGGLTERDRHRMRKVAS